MSQARRGGVQGLRRGGGQGKEETARQIVVTKLAWSAKGHRLLPALYHIMSNISGAYDSLMYICMHASLRLRYLFDLSPIAMTSFLILFLTS
jgi:hypothetical protein